jgi:hypothetical protein
MHGHPSADSSASEGGQLLSADLLLRRLFTGEVGKAALGAAAGWLLASCEVARQHSSSSSRAW